MGKLHVNTAIFDMTNTTPEALQKYDHIHVNTALLVVSESSKHLLAKGSISINMAKMVQLEDKCEACTVNGGLTIGPDSAVPSKPTLLTVNGGLTVCPGSRKAVEGYEFILVNGGLTIPYSIPYSNVMVNGGITTYPDDAVLLQDLIINDSFINSVKPGTRYFVKGILKDLECDPSPLYEKKITIQCSNVVVHAEYESALAQIIENRQNWVRIPTGFTYTGSTELDLNTVYQYGKKLYIDGDLHISQENAHVLDSLDAYIVTGYSLIPETLLEKYMEKIIKTGGLLTYKGELWQISESSETLTRELLDDTPDGITIFLKDSELTIAQDISNEEYMNKVHAIHGSDSVITISPQLKTLLRKKVKGKVELNVHDEQQEAKAKSNEVYDTCINTQYYKF